MASASTYLNFKDQTEEAFNFYKSIFKNEFDGNGFNRFGDMPPMEGAPAMPENEKKLILHVTLPILGGHLLMGSDAPESMGFTINKGNNFFISLNPDSKEQADELFNALSAGGAVQMPMTDMFWGAYWGSFADKFGVQWMVNFVKPK